MMMVMMMMMMGMLEMTMMTMQGSNELQNTYHYPLDRAHKNMGVDFF